MFGRLHKYKQTVLFHGLIECIVLVWDLSWVWQTYILVSDLGTGSLPVAEQFNHCLFLPQLLCPVSTMAVCHPTHLHDNVLRYTHTGHLDNTSEP